MSNLVSLPEQVLQFLWQYMHDSSKKANFLGGQFKLQLPRSLAEALFNLYPGMHANLALFKRQYFAIRHDPEGAFIL